MSGVLVPPIHKRTRKLFLVYVCGGDLTVNKSSASTEDGTLQVNHLLLPWLMAHLHYSLKKIYPFLKHIRASRRSLPPTPTPIHCMHVASHRLMKMPYKSSITLMITVHLIHVQNNLQLDELMNELQSLQLKKSE